MAGETSEPGPTIWDCPSGPSYGDRGTPEGVLSEADSWLILTKIGPELREYAETDLSEAQYRSLPLAVREWDDGSGTGAVRTTTFEVFSDDAPWIVKAIDQGEKVYLSTTTAFVDKPGDEERIYQAIAETSTGELYFAGACGAVALRVPLQNRWGAEYQDRLRSILGETDADVITAALVKPVPGVSEPPVVGENVGTEGLTAFDLVMIPGDSLSPDYALCAHVQRGSLGCVSTSMLGDASYRLSLPVFASPGEPVTLDLEDERTSDLEGTFGEVALDWAAVEAAEERGGAVVTVRLLGDASRSTGSNEVVEVFAFDDLEADEKLRDQVYGVDRDKE